MIQNSFNKFVPEKQNQPDYRNRMMPWGSMTWPGFIFAFLSGAMLLSIVWLMFLNFSSIRSRGTNGYYAPPFPPPGQGAASPFDATGDVNSVNQRTNPVVTTFSWDDVQRGMQAQIEEAVVSGKLRGERGIIGSRGQAGEPGPAGAPGMTIFMPGTETTPKVYYVDRTRSSRSSGSDDSSNLSSPGSVAFQGNDDSLTEDNDNLFFDDDTDTLGVGTSAPVARLHVAGVTLQGQDSGTIAAANFTASLSKDDANAKTYAVVNIQPTIDTGSLNQDTGLDVLNIDTVNVGLTGTDVNLIRAASGGATKFAVDSDGNVDVAGTLTAAGLSVSGNLNPATDGTSDLGSSTKPWRTIHVNSVVTAGAPANGVIYANGSGALTATPTGGAGTLCLVSTNGGAPTFSSCAGSAGSAWSGLTSPSADLSVSMQNFSTNFTYGNATGAGVNLFTLQDSAANTGTGYLLNLATATGSSLKPLRVSVNGGTDALTVAASGLVTANTFGSSGVAITGGVINGTSIGGVTPAAGNFTNLSATGALTSTLATGTAPLVVASTTPVANLTLATDAQLPVISTSGKVANSATTATSSNTGLAIVARDASGNFSAGTITANLNGNALTATTAGSVSGVVAVPNGGTGAVSFTSHGLLYGNGTAALSATAAPTGGQLLIGNSTGVPTFVSLSGDAGLSDTGVLTIAANAITLGTDTAGNYVAGLTGNAQVAVSGSGSEGATVSVSLNPDSIGDAQLAFDTGQNLTSISTPSFSGLSITSLNSNGGLVYANGSGALAQISAGTNGQLLVGNSGGAPGFVSLSGDASLSAGGALTIVTGAVTGNKIADATITATDLASGDFSSKITSGTYSINIGGNAVTVTDGVYTTGSYANPSWITSLDGSKITGLVSGAESDTLATVTARGASTATGLTLSSSSPLTFSGTTPTLTFSGGNTTLDLTGGATRTLSITNSTAAQVADLDLADGGLRTAGTLRLTNTGALQNVTADAAIITSGSLAPTRGGTGLSSLGSANQLLGITGGAGGLEYKTLNVGTNLSLIHGAGTMTLGLSATPTFTTVNGLAFTPGSDGFTVSGGTTSRSLTVTGGNISINGGGNTLTLTGSATLNQDVATSSTPTFAGLTVNGTTNLNGTVTLTGSLLGNNTLVTTSTLANVALSGTCLAALNAAGLAVFQSSATITTSHIYYNITRNRHSRITSVTSCTDSGGNPWRILTLADTIAGFVLADSIEIYNPGTDIGNASSGFINNIYAVKVNAVAGSLVGGFDVAEQYPTTDESIEAGDVVAVDEAQFGIRKSAGRYDTGLLGVVSTSPALTLGKDNTGWKKVALTGRVPVKVSTENGPILPGDYLTSSSIPGVAMKATKAGVVIGKALEAFVGPDLGTVTVFVGTAVSNGSLQPNEIAAVPATGADDSASFGVATLQKLLATQFSDSVPSGGLDNSSVHTDMLIADSRIVTPDLFAGTISADTIHGATGDGLTIDGKAFFKGGLYAASIAAADDTLFTIASDTLFIGRPYLTGDSAGFAVITRGQRSVRITFDREYTDRPVTSATIAAPEADSQADAVKTALSDGIQYAITAVGTTGFTIILNKNAPVDVPFSWTAFGVKDAKLFSSYPDDVTNTDEDTDTEEEIVMPPAPPQPPVSDEAPIGRPSDASPDQPVSPAEDEDLKEAVPPPDPEPETIAPVSSDDPVAGPVVASSHE